MKDIMKKKTESKNLNNILEKLIEAENRLNKLPSLSEVEKAKLELSRDTEHLYYSSKIEGTALTQKRIEKAVYGKGF